MSGKCLWVRKPLRFLVKLEKPLPQACKSDVEMYYTDRFMTFTFDRVPGTSLVIATRQKEIESLYAEFKGKEPDTHPLSPSAERVLGGGMVGVSCVGVSEDEVDWRSLLENTFDDDAFQPKRSDVQVLRRAMSAANRDLF